MEENIADALKMAAAVLVFVVALSIIINAFGEVRKTSQTILDYKDRKYDYTYITPNNTETQRIVGAETIVPSIYRAYKEQYKIVFEGIFLNELDEKGLYSVYNSATGDYDSVECIDMDTNTPGSISLGNDTLKELFIKAILYGKNSFTTDEERKNLENFMNERKIHLNSDGIYDTINKKQFKEKLGIYDRNEISYNTSEKKFEKMKSTTKDIKRVITYEQLI